MYWGVTEGKKRAEKIHFSLSKASVEFCIVVWVLNGKQKADI